MQYEIGIDVSKAMLDAYCSRSTQHRQFENTAAGLAALGRWASGRNSFVVFEGEAD